MSNMLFQIKQYIQFLIKAQTRFTIHSPFVYNLVEQVFRDHKVYPEYAQLNQMKNALLKRRSVVETVDFGSGAGNNKYKTKRLPLKTIVKQRSQHKSRLELLYRLSKSTHPEYILEFGTAAGVSSAYLKSGAPDSQMITMEGCSGLAAIAQEVFQQLNLSNIEVEVGNFDVILDDVLKKFTRLDFVFFDGNHRKKPTLNYFYKCLPLAHENTLFIFDDIHWSPEMKESWEEIKRNDEASITIDLFWFGLVFFRKGIEKQDFVIRY